MSAFDRLRAEVRVTSWVGPKIDAEALYLDPRATLDDLREAMTTLEDAERIARRVFGSPHPTTNSIEVRLRNARAVLRHLEKSSSGDA